jgi:3-hydroxyisobutyrate dehydrogenase-like beta-hydroxyacid dehydrogenase
MAAGEAVGFIGLGVMGEPICRHLRQKSGRPVIAFDERAAPLERLGSEGVHAAGSAREVAAAADVVFLCLPGGKQVESVVEGGVLGAATAGQVLVDLGTSPVGLARRLAAVLEQRGAGFADAPIARTREAAQRGTLSAMVGARPEVFTRIEPLIRCFATDITHCGEPGSGQIVKLLNNMVLFQTVNALAEALAVGRRAGIDPALLFETLAKGSADSFALRNHGMKAMLPGVFPERAFSTEYALKDLSYALELARETGVAARGAEVAEARLREAITAGFGACYFPALARTVDAR